jgi:anti-sigma B factor antagonist
MSSELPPLAVHIWTADDGERCVVELEGEIDLVTATRVIAEFDAVFAQPSVPVEIHVDLAGVSFMDTVGIGAILRARGLAVESGRRFRVTSTSPVIERLFAVTGITTLLVGET